MTTNLYVCFMENEKVTVQMRIKKDLHDKAKKKAEKLGLNFSAYVRFLLSKDLEQ